MTGLLVVGIVWLVFIGALSIAIWYGGRGAGPGIGPG